MSGYVVWLTGDRTRMDALAEALRVGLAGTAGALDVLTAELVEDKLCSNEPRGADFRDVVVRRLGWLGHVLARNGCALIAVAASPRREVRDDVRKQVGNFLELLVHGTMPDGYETPHYPEVEAAAGESPAAVVAKVRQALLDNGYVAAGGNVYSADEEAKIKDRLEKLGYL
jgi:adenylylsulfate kinase